jgi:hypothetical protein
VLLDPYQFGAVFFSIIGVRSFLRTRAKKKKRAAAAHTTEARYSRDIGSPIASAHIIYDSRQAHLDIWQVAEAINNSSYKATAQAEIVRFAKGIDFPLVRVMDPLSFVIVVDEHPEVIEEIEEMIGEAEHEGKLPAAVITKLKNCNARLGISSSNRPVIDTGDRLTVFATTDLDPANPEVLQIIHTLEDLSGGVAFNCVDGEWISKD